MKQELFVICRTEKEFLKIWDDLLEDYIPVNINSMQAFEGRSVNLYMLYGGYERLRDWPDIEHYLIIQGAKEVEYDHPRKNRQETSKKS